jgi:hypothetical protein
VIALALLAACWREPSVTGPTGMAGRIVDSRGKPLSGILVHTLESNDTTDDDGHFAVLYKDPDQLLNFVAHTAPYYTRRYTPADDGTVVTIAMPEGRDATVVCAAPQPCELHLAWDLGSGLVASVRVPCSGAADRPFSGLPVGTPAVTCTTDAGADVPIALTDEGKSLVIGPPRIPARIEVRGDEGFDPSTCVVTAGDATATPSGTGSWSVDVAGVVTASAVCDGRPAVPQALHAGPDASATLVWSATGPSFDPPAMATAGDLWLVLDGPDGWMIRIPRGSDGSYPLPPLAAGTYRIAIGDAGALATVLAPAHLDEAGVVQVLAVTPGDGATPGGLVGALRLDRDVTEGSLPVVGL